MKKKFFIKNLVFFIIPLLIPLLILGGFSITITRNFVMEDINKANIRALNQAKESTELIFNDLDSLSLNFSLDPSFISKYKSILQSNSLSYEGYEVLGTILNMVNPSVNSKTYIQSVYVYFDNPKGNFLVSNEGILNVNNYIDKSWYDSFLKSDPGINSWIETRNIKQYDFEKQGTDLITIYKKLYSPGVSKADGVIVMNIKRSYIDAIQMGILIHPQQTVLILDNNDNIIAGINSINIKSSEIKALNTNMSQLFEFKSSNNLYIVSQVRSSRYALKFLSIIPRQNLYEVPIKLLYITILLLIVSLVLGLILALIITRKNYNNLLNIITAFESAEKGTPLPQLPPRVNDEYSFILQNVIKTFIEQSYLKVQLSEKKYRLKTMEFIALQSQINPHFLFNTLKTLFWKSINLTGEQNEVSKMIEHLSEILTYSLGNSEKTVTLESEIKNTLSYIEIQKVRYKDKFRVIWQYDEALTNINVLKFLFQPIIENCIYHGIKEKEGESFIKVKINLIDSKLRIAIIDNGLGMKPEILANLRERLQMDTEVSEHIGIYNTSKRLKLAYGDEYGINIRSKFGLGTVVYITIPVKSHSTQMLQIT